MPKLVLMLGIPVPKRLGLVVSHQGGLQMHFERLDSEGWFGEWKEGKSAGITQQIAEQDHFLALSGTVGCVDVVFSDMV